MKILKFGGSSIADSKRIENVINILKTFERQKIAVVFSAFYGVTDNLILIGKLAEKKDTGYIKTLHKLSNRHLKIIEELNNKNNSIKIKKQVSKIFTDIENILKGVYLIRELTPRTLDYIMSFGEKLSCTIISQTLNTRSYKNEYLQADKLIITDSVFNNARVNFAETNENIKKYFTIHKKTQIITGFIGTNENYETTTLGRGGSDYTAAIFGAALNASEIQIWTDVKGILTADPQKVSESFPLKTVSYEEAMELSHFGAKVIHPPTILPALNNKIRIRIKSTFDPSCPGTIISKREEGINFKVKGISSIDDISLLRIQGGGMVGVTGIASRLFTCLAKKEINIILITQGSSEHSICIAVLPQHGKEAKNIIEKEFKLEIKENKISRVIVDEGLSIIAVVGEGMKETPGISGKVFDALGKNGINILAIAQGSSELNISLVVEKASLKKALNVLHEALFLSKQKTLNLFLVGPGLVGGTLLNQIAGHMEYLQRELQTKIRLVGLANSKKMLIKNEGIKISNWKKELERSKEEINLHGFVKSMKQLNLPFSVFIDTTASGEIANHYKDILSSSISLVTPNKIAASSSYSNYLLLNKTAKENNVQFRYTTNVGAALPIINTLKDIITNGDKIVKIEGVLSGTLSYIFNSLKENKRFSDIVKQAKHLGYTEPFIWDDLSGKDVVRKLIILVRESGIPIEMKDVKVERLLPEKFKKYKNPDLFLKELKKYDSVFEKRNKSAQRRGKILKYIAKYENKKATVKIEEIDEEHPFYNLSNVDNIVAFTTKNYNVKPLVIRGPGAGAELTASGVLVDVLRVSNYLS